MQETYKNNFATLKFTPHTQESLQFYYQDFKEMCGLFSSGCGRKKIYIAYIRSQKVKEQLGHTTSIRPTKGYRLTKRLLVYVFFRKKGFHR
jgi:hypothetical protein